MTAGLDGGARPALVAGMRLQYEPAQSAHVLLYPEGMVKLNGTAGAILERCSGERTLEQIVADLEKSYGASGLTKDVSAFIAYALEKHWLELRA
ncbi:MAG TPA: pyrroloquinoline quinone biosynthesis peptide chaperone PqqD [Steroidobacteraceae bacterium]|nr:pyrroloquinoline quinone biosynthesis peptide chaperone PqqD [Steroidobacteraceae bacterium]